MSKTGEALPIQKWLGLLNEPNEPFDRYLSEDVYARGGAEYVAAQKERYRAALEAHRRRFGEGPCFLLRAPGRLNAFLEYLDMCAGDHMSTTIDGDIPLVLTPREDDTVVVCNTSELFPERSFSISEELEKFAGAPWGTGESAGLEDDWDNRTRVHPYYGRAKGDHINYVIAAFLRFAWEKRGSRLRGADMTFGPSTIPLRAGTSSSSAVVVLSALSCLEANRGGIPEMSRERLSMILGEAEWYVGTHGGANDHATILCNEPGGILYNRHSRDPLEVTRLPFLKGLSLIVANSLWEANKALGANYVFNLRKGWMDLGNDLLELALRELVSFSGPKEPGWVARCVSERFGRPLDPKELSCLDDLDWDFVKKRYRLFGSLDETILGIPQETIAQLIRLIPEEIDPAEAEKIVGKDRAALARDYTLPDEKDRVWRPRNAARFFNRENVIGRRIEKLLLEAREFLSKGGDEESGEYDRFRKELGDLIESVQETIRDDFMVSNDQLELILDIARKGPGYVAGKLTGAGSGGCVCIFVREREAEAMCSHLDRAYYRVPENFTAYREELSRVEDSEVRAEMERNLEEALAAPEDQRRIVSFSRGAGMIRPA